MGVHSFVRSFVRSFMQSFMFTVNEAPINFARAPQDQCTEQLVCQSCDPFKGKQMSAGSDNTFTVQIGPSGNERGYMGITGKAVSMSAQ